MTLFKRYVVQILFISHTFKDIHSKYDECSKEDQTKQEEFLPHDQQFRVNQVFYWIFHDFNLHLCATDKYVYDNI